MNSEMALKHDRIEIRNHLTGNFHNNISEDVYRGLTAPRKFIPSKYFYDDRGSRLFEKICRLPEYYQTRTEMSILRNAAPDILQPFDIGDMVELGSGANWKIRVLLDAAGDGRIPSLRYVPVDVSDAALISASEELLEIYPELEVFGIIADFTRHIDRIPDERPRLFIFLGSTIGNFDEKDRKIFLRRVAASMKPCDRFIIGFDMLKPKDTLEAAYNDSQGVTADFNKNVLRVLNRELHANFDLSQFEHVASFNEEKERVEMHLRAMHRVEASIKDIGLTVELEKDETIHTEICAKFTRMGIESLAAEAGLRVDRWFTDSKKWFSVAELALNSRG